MARGEIRPLLSPNMIRRARKLAGIDQARLASLAGITRKTVIAVEATLSEKPDARRRAVLERIRLVFEHGYDLEFTFADHPDGEGVRRKIEPTEDVAKED